MADIKSPKLLYLKALAFVLVGLLASAAILIERPSLQIAFLLALAIWAFARAYYFAFYVIQHYIDPEFKFAGLLSFAQYFLKKRK